MKVSKIITFLIIVFDLFKLWCNLDIEALNKKFSLFQKYHSKLFQKKQELYSMLIK